MPNTEKIKNLLQNVSGNSVYSTISKDSYRFAIGEMLKGKTIPNGTSQAQWTNANEFGKFVPRLWHVKNGDLKMISRQDAVSKIEAGEVIMYSSQQGPVYISATEYDGSMYLQCMTSDYAAQMKNTEAYHTVSDLKLAEPTFLDRIINAICEFFNIGKRDVCAEWDAVHSVEKIENANTDLGDIDEKINQNLEAEYQKESEAREKEAKKEEKEAKKEAKIEQERIKLENKQLLDHAKMLEDNMEKLPDESKMGNLNEKMRNVENNLHKANHLNSHGTTIYAQENGRFTFDPKQDDYIVSADIAQNDLYIIALCSTNDMTSNYFINTIASKDQIVYPYLRMNKVNEGLFTIDEYHNGMNNAEKILCSIDPSSPEAFLLGEAYANIFGNDISLQTVLLHSSSRDKSKAYDEYGKEREMPSDVKTILDFQAKVRDGLKALNNLADDNYYKNNPDHILSSLKMVAKGMMAREMLTSLGKMEPDKRAKFLKQPKNIQAFSRLEKELVDFVDKSKAVYNTKKTIWEGLGNSGGILRNFNKAQKELHNEINNADLKNVIDAPKNKIDEPKKNIVESKEPMVPGVNK